MFTLYLKKKGNLCLFNLTTILQYINIVNNTASLYVEYSIQRFYFNHLVGILDVTRVPRHHVVCRTKMKLGSAVAAPQRHECIICVRDLLPEC